MTRRWLALVVIALAQLMVALDATIVSVALPTIQRALGASDAQRAWVVTAYLLAFGGLLLIGGRVSDAIGRRRAFITGLIGFAASSVLAGLAPSFGTLVAARALQGASAALLSPTALSLVAVMFTDRRERARAFAVFGGVAGSGGALGLILGGALTGTVGWRWCLYVNVAFAAIAIIGALRTLPRSEPGHGSIDLVATARTAIRAVLDRNRGGAALTAGLAVIAMFGMFLLLTYYFQVVRHLSPLEAGLAFLPMSAAGLLGSTTVASRLLPHVAPRAMMVGGLAIAAAGLAILTRITEDTAYVTGILPAELCAGFGISCAMIAAFSVATLGVAPRDAGVASAVIVTAQQLGGSVGTSLLNAVAASATAAYGGSAAGALVHGYAVATGWGCAVLVAAAVLAGVLVTAGKPGRSVPLIRPGGALSKEA